MQVGPGEVVGGVLVGVVGAARYRVPGHAGVAREEWLLTGTLVDHLEFAFVEFNDGRVEGRAAAGEQLTGVVEDDQVPGGFCSPSNSGRSGGISS